MATLESVKPSVGGDVDCGQGATVVTGVGLFGHWARCLGLRGTWLRQVSDISG